ncbi:primosomal protein N' [Helicobacter enhydrae]|uniref:Replication restart protein PriA n=1 Tax=Helicobacter enhydrae TaxID=222136 RepID=A0A1B1U4T9_9HELI|nr:primosomal protein N' [Helicobacter enhydrae]ANV97814.1 primosomal protein N' [Helicobacter enhydrae]
MKYYLLAPIGLNTPSLTYSASAVVQEGRIVEIDIRNKSVMAVVLSEVQKPEFPCNEMNITEEFLLPHQIALAQFVTQYYCATLSQTYALFVPCQSQAPIQYPTTQPPTFQPILPLSQQQQGAFEFIQSRECALLFGATGSGKSEVYIHCLVDVLASGKTALLLIPEIGLTPQMHKRLEKVFGASMGVWHSKISKKHKQKLLNGIQDGTIRLVIGTRSALFLPLQSLGMIIVDEEHDDSYKSQQAPRYNARDLAIYLGNKIGAKVLLGSATPSLKTYYQMREKQGIYRLKKHFDTRVEILFLDEPTSLSARVCQSIEQEQREGRQIMIFTPTRANFKSLMCGDCGYSFACPFCSVSMSVHSRKNLLRCHYCHFTQALPISCPQCNGGHLHSHRIGTAQISQELQERFPSMQIGIFDRDHIKTQKKLEETLGQFERSEIDCLVGTQMLSKGHDYPNVGLVVIMGLDYVLHSADYKAKEKAMSLLFQIKGRCGRYKNGKVLIQTQNQGLFEQYLEDYEAFLQSELQYVRDLYPPFKKLATLTFVNANASKAQAQMHKVLEILKKLDDIEVVGGGRACIERIKGKYRFVILLRSDRSVALIRAISASLIYEKFEIDIDPLNIV